MNSLPPSLQHLALQQRLTSRLRDAIDRLRQRLQEAEPTVSLESDRVFQPATFSSEIASFSRGKDLTQISYSSPIALRLSGLWALPSTCLAKQIATCFSNEAEETEPPELAKSGRCLITQVTPPGWIVVRLNDLGIALWLQMLTTQHLHGEDAQQSANDSNASSKNDHDFYQNANNLFEIQHTHARCCTLLRMGIQAGLLSSNHFRTSDLSIQVGTRSIFPWLMGNDTLRLQNHAEKYLIGQLFVTLDQLSTEQQCAFSLVDRRRIGLNLAALLSQRIKDFYAVCRIFGDVQLEQVELAQARLGLILASKTLLSFILQDWLEVAAPTEL